MALRVLTATERELLKENQTFAERCYWAIRDYAAYWSTHDGAGLATEADRIKWAKDRQNSVQIVLNDIGDQAVPLKFVKIAKGMQFDLGTAPENIEDILAAIPDNKYEEMASFYFNLLGENINFSASGN